MKTKSSVPLKCFDGVDACKSSLQESKLRSIKSNRFLCLGGSDEQSISECTETHEESCLELSKRNTEVELPFWSLLWWKDSSGTGTSSWWRSTLIFSKYHFVALMGKKDAIIVIIFCVVNAISIAWWFSFYCLFCCPARRKPEHVDLVVTSALDAQLTVENATFCNTNSSYLNLTQQNEISDTVLTKISSSYWEISLCLGWTRREYNAINQVPTAVHISGLLVLMLYCNTDLKQFWGTSLVQWMVILFAFFFGLSLALNDAVLSVLMAPVMVLIVGFCIEHSRFIQWQLNFKWFPPLLVVMSVNVFLCMMAQNNFALFDKIIAYIPLLLIASELLFSCVLRKCFKKNRDNLQGMVLLISTFLFMSEGIRFGSFLALYIGYKKNVRRLDSLLMSIAFSIAGEIWSHSGIREVGWKWAGKRIWFLSEDDAFPAVIWGISSIRLVLEWIIPLTVLSNFFVINSLNSCIPIIEEDITNQIRFFTSHKLPKDFCEVIACYYCVELLSLLLCRLIVKWTSHLQFSAIGSLDFSKIIILGVLIFFLSPTVDPIYFIPSVMGYEY